MEVPEASTTLTCIEDIEIAQTFFDDEMIVLLRPLVLLCDAVPDCKPSIVLHWFSSNEDYDPKETNEQQSSFRIEYYRPPFSLDHESLAFFLLAFSIVKKNIFYILGDNLAIFK